jgi:hypothetical protein
MGIPRADEMVLTTEPYYRSTYVFVWREDRHYAIRSFDDPRLKKLKVGVHVIGDDYNALPPGMALARRGIVKNVVGYSIYGDYSRPSPPSELIGAVADGTVDVAIAWGRSRATTRRASGCRWRSLPSRRGWRCRECRSNTPSR